MVPKLFVKADCKRAKATGGHYASFFVGKGGLPRRLPIRSLSLVLSFVPKPRPQAA
jgi:hypothetical protein